jgi:hypothetical protein
MNEESRFTEEQIIGMIKEQEARLLAPHNLEHAAYQPTSRYRPKFGRSA